MTRAVESVITDNAERAGWNITFHGDAYEISNPEATLGLPVAMGGIIRRDKNSISDGWAIINYGEGDDLNNIPWKLQVRVFEYLNPHPRWVRKRVNGGVLEVLKGVWYPYRPFWDALKAAPLSEKKIGRLVGESERQIFNARASGLMDSFLADKLWVKVMKRHPGEVYGAEDWALQVL